MARFLLALGVMGLTDRAKAKVGQALSGVRAGDDKLASRKLCGGAPSIDVKSRAFQAGAPLPPSSSADGGGTPPPLEWGAVPTETKSLVVMCEDPDAPLPEPFLHWTVYGIPPTVHALSGASVGRWKEGENSTLRTGFTGAAPPPGHGVHRYHFQVFALDTELPLDTGAGRGALLGAMKDHVLAFGDLLGTYQRN
jgi:Raf kinase inhibitor-like YbhB/YbcL family protein